MIDCTQVLDEDDSNAATYIGRLKVGNLEIKGQCYDIYTGENIIGRDDLSDIVIRSASISNKHAVIEVEDWETHFIFDCGSTNKTRLGKVILKPNARYELKERNDVMFANITAKYTKLARPQTTIPDNDDSGSETGSESMLNCEPDDNNVLDFEESPLKVVPVQGSEVIPNRSGSFNLNESSFLEENRKSSSSNNMHVVEASMDESTDDEDDFFVLPSQTVKEYNSSRHETKLTTRKKISSQNILTEDVIGSSESKGVEINNSRDIFEMETQEQGDIETCPKNTSIKVALDLINTQSVFSSEIKFRDPKEQNSKDHEKTNKEDNGIFEAETQLNDDDICINKVGKGEVGIFEAETQLNDDDICINNVGKGEVGIFEAETQLNDYDICINKVGKGEVSIFEAETQLNDGEICILDIGKNTDNRESNILTAENDREKELVNIFEAETQLGDDGVFIKEVTKNTDSGNCNLFDDKTKQNLGQESDKEKEGQANMFEAETELNCNILRIQTNPNKSNDCFQDDLDMSELALSRDENVGDEMSREDALTQVNPNLVKRSQKSTLNYNCSLDPADKSNQDQHESDKNDANKISLEDALTQVNPNLVNGDQNNSFNHDCSLDPTNKSNNDQSDLDSNNSNDILLEDALTQVNPNLVNGAQNISFNNDRSLDPTNKSNQEQLELDENNSNKISLEDALTQVNPNLVNSAQTSSFSLDSTNKSNQEQSDLDENNDIDIPLECALTQANPHLVKGAQTTSSNHDCSVDPTNKINQERHELDISNLGEHSMAEQNVGCLDNNLDNDIISNALTQVNYSLRKSSREVISQSSKSEEIATCTIKKEKNQDFVEQQNLIQPNMNEMTTCKDEKDDFDIEATQLNLNLHNLPAENKIENLPNDDFANAETQPFVPQQTPKIESEFDDSKIQDEQKIKQLLKYLPVELINIPPLKEDKFVSLNAPTDINKSIKEPIDIGKSTSKIVSEKTLNTNISCSSELCGIQGDSLNMKTQEKCSKEKAVNENAATKNTSVTDMEICSTIDDNMYISKLSTCESTKKEQTYTKSSVKKSPLINSNNKVDEKIRKKGKSKQMKSKKLFECHKNINSTNISMQNTMFTGPCSSSTPLKTTGVDNNVESSITNLHQHQLQTPTKDGAPVLYDSPILPSSQELLEVADKTPERNQDSQPQSTKKNLPLALSKSPRIKKPSRKLTDDFDVFSKDVNKGIELKNNQKQDIFKQKEHSHLSVNSSFSSIRNITKNTIQDPNNQTKLDTDVYKVYELKNVKVKLTKSNIGSHHLEGKKNCQHTEISSRSSIQTNEELLNDGILLYQEKDNTSEHQIKYIDTDSKDTCATNDEHNSIKIDTTQTSSAKLKNRKCVHSSNKNKLSSFDMDQQILNAKDQCVKINQEDKELLKLINPDNEKEGLEKQLTLSNVETKHLSNKTLPLALHRTPRIRKPSRKCLDDLGNYIKKGIDDLPSEHTLEEDVSRQKKKNNSCLTNNSNVVNIHKKDPVADFNTETNQAVDTCLTKASSSKYKDNSSLKVKKNMPVVKSNEERLNDDQFASKTRKRNKKELSALDKLVQGQTDNAEESLSTKEKCIRLDKQASTGKENSKTSCASICQEPINNSTSKTLSNLDSTKTTVTPIKNAPVINTRSKIKQVKNWNDAEVLDEISQKVSESHPKKSKRIIKKDLVSKDKAPSIKSTIANDNVEKRAKRNCKTISVEELPENINKNAAEPCVPVKRSKRGQVSVEYVTPEKEVFYSITDSSSNGSSKEINPLSKNKRKLKVHSEPLNESSPLKNLKLSAMNDITEDAHIISNSSNVIENKTEKRRTRKRLNNSQEKEDTLPVNNSNVSSPERKRINKTHSSLETSGSVDSDSRGLERRNRKTTNDKPVFAVPTKSNSRKKDSNVNNQLTFEAVNSIKSPNTPTRTDNVDKRIGNSSRSRSESISSRESTDSRRGTPRRSSVKRELILFTGLSDPNLEANIKKLGGKVADCPRSCTVLVTDKVRRTVKFLCSLGQGKPIVTSEWITQSMRCMRFQDPMEYLLKDPEAEQRFQFRLAQSLEQAKRQPLLSGYSVHATPSVKPPPEELKNIIECCGGVYLEKIPSKWANQCLVISHPDDSSLWKKLKVKGVTPPIVAVEMILLGVLQQRLDVETHKIV